MLKKMKLKKKYLVLLFTTTALNAKINKFKNKIPNVSNLVKKTDYNIKIPEIENIILYYCWSWSW